MVDQTKTKEFQKQLYKQLAILENLVEGLEFAEYWQHDNFMCILNERKLLYIYQNICIWMQ